MCTMCRMEHVPKVDMVSEFPKGWHFMRKEDEYSISDPGFAIARADGKVLHGIDANLSLHEIELDKNTEDD